ncbi:hypothetical protein A2555_02835 [Candidatus Falkowbacteria bacterium RIFOXYD2_FULL_39_16]|nr:MAG: hypothetical protein A2555_02835 [Candidatus Falkowbacteria bacterium RIFOXYD2_FULL_39_16]
MNRIEIPQSDLVDETIEKCDAENLIETLVREDLEKRNFTGQFGGTFKGLREMETRRILEEGIKKGLEEGRSSGEIEDYLRKRLELPKQ